MKRYTRRQAIQRRLVLYLAALLVAYMIVCYRLAQGYLSPVSHVPALPVGLNEDHIATEAGQDPVWTTPHFGQRKVLFVLAHGYGGTRDSWTELMRELDSKGFDCIAPAMPGQDASPDKTVGFGIKEAKVIADAVRWSRTRYAKAPKVVLMGVSMGGAASWMATSLVPDVDGVVTEGAYARFDEAMNRYFERISGTNPSSIVPLKAAEKWHGRPALVIQGAEDELIPRNHAERLAAASGGELWVVPGATHAYCMEAEPEEYLRKLVAFAGRL